MYTLVFMQAHIRFGIGIVPWCEFREDMNEHVMINCCDVAKCCKSLQETLIWKTLNLDDVLDRLAC